MWNHMGYFGDGWLWPMALHGAMSLLWIGLLVLGIVVVVRLATGGVRRGGTALAALETRYANGEIGREEFLQRRKDLS